MAGDKYCAGCGQLAIFPDQNNQKQRRPPRQNERLTDLSQEKEAADAYYRSVGSRHPHIWPVSGIGQALFTLCLAAVALLIYTLTGQEAALRYNLAGRLAFTAAGAFCTLLSLNMIRWVFVPEVRPGSNPEMVGSKGDFLVFIIGIPIVLLALLNWLDWLDPLIAWIKQATR